MTFDLEHEQRLAADRLRRKLERDVAAAMARINQPTSTELAEIEAGLRRGRPTWWESLGMAWRQFVDGLAAIAMEFNRGYTKGGKQ